MLDTQIIRKNPEETQVQLARRGFNFPLENYKNLEQQRKELQSNSELLQAQKNTLAKQIGQAKAKQENCDELLQEGQNISEKLLSAEQQTQEIQKKLHDLLARLPNIPVESVPHGTSELDNIEVTTWGNKPVFPENHTVLDHVALGEKLGLDFETATLITGSRFSVLKGQIAKLHRALAQFMLDTHGNEHGYHEVYVPYMVNADSLYGTGQLPKFSEDLFKIEFKENDPWYLIPTAEVPVTNLVRDCILNEQELPLKFVAHTPCFRSEAGSYGKDTKGLIRQHQFEKVELVQIVKPETAEQTLEELTNHACNILEKLELPYRKVLLCTGDMGFSSQKTYDLEVWLPGQNTYREISSCSWFGDFQSRRLQARYKYGTTENGKTKQKTELVHTLNGSGLAVGRTLVAILENYQQTDGSVTIPTVLRPYMNGLTHLSI